MEASKYHLIDMSTFKETGDTVDATRITMFNDDTLFVKDAIGILYHKIQGR